MRSFDSGGVDQLRLMLGNILEFPLHFCKEFANECGKALWCVSKTIKNYAMLCWRYRAERLGRISLRGSVVSFSLPAGTCSDPRSCVPSGKVASAEETEWAEWVPKTGGLWDDFQRGVLRPAVYRVFRGRSTGVFYRWSDVLRNVANFDNAKFKGYATFREAYDDNPESFDSPLGLNDIGADFAARDLCVDFPG